MKKCIKQTRLRVLIFNDSRLLSSIVKALSQFAVTRQLNWVYRPMGNEAILFFLKLPYRLIESTYWILRLLIEVKRFQPHIIVTQYAHLCGLIGAIASTLARKRFVVQALGSDLRIHSNQSIFSRMMVMLTFRMASGVICVSRDLETIAKRLGARHTEVIPDAVDLSCSCDTTVSRKEKVIITVARLVQIKGICYLIRAMASLKECSLVVIGDGPERGKLESLSENLGLSSRVSFVGWISDRSRLICHLKQATVFVLPSLSEGIPRAIIEAMACGLPIVATRVGGIPEFVVEGVNGLLVSPRDEKALVKAIEKTISDTDFHRITSAKNKELARKFIPTIIGRRTYSYLKDVVS